MNSLNVFFMPPLCCSCGDHPHSEAETEGRQCAACQTVPPTTQGLQLRVPSRQVHLPARFTTLPFLTLAGHISGSSGRVAKGVTTLDS